MATEITVLTFNLWGIFNASNRRARMVHFASKVKDYDVIMLQEQFSEEDFELIMDHVPPEIRKQRYFRRFPSAFYGSGVAVISKYPIKSTLFFAYPLQGYPEKVHHGDFYANKGVALVRICVPCETAVAPSRQACKSLDSVEKHEANDAGQVAGSQCRDVLVYSAHFVAVYENPNDLLDWRDELYLSVRLGQCISFANFIIATSRPSDYIIIGGDFNSALDSMEVKTMLLLLKRHGYRIRSVLPNAERPRPEMQQHERDLHMARMTFSHECMFTPTPIDVKTFTGYEPVQIDHIFVSSNTLELCMYEDCPGASPEFPFTQELDGKEVPSGVVVFKKNDEVTVPPSFGTRHRVGSWVARVGGCIGVGPLGVIGRRLIRDWKVLRCSETTCALSDHYGVAARLRLLPPEKENGERNNTQRCDSAWPSVSLETSEEEWLLEVVEFLEDSVRDLQRQSRRYLKLSWLGASVTCLGIAYALHNLRSSDMTILSLLGTALDNYGGDVKGAVCKNGTNVSLPCASLYRGGESHHVHNDSAQLSTGPSVSNVTFLHRVLEHAITPNSLSMCMWHWLSLCLIILSFAFTIGTVIIALLNRNAYAKIMGSQLEELRGILAKKEAR
ncbi:putative Endonuclease Exonuclease phosphatase family [Trypanosoma vivax]|uniref:Endonuclease/exonuclease/phosphatase domain-containing protein n=1 Tax=Trypanosoma vivax (strain Y486) TaxID=1055687 RepID=G0TVZ6_TRYVY|nr:hypothetical protein TRVL_03028 [Trypanosoma vivax]KAH8607239.1 putative Endonuclease Exonuclease phosphatase family [Trypanosoma vivax]CCC48112.1 conserved hypothetical protein [Trypanosoma vivax Y486]